MPQPLIWHDCCHEDPKLNFSLSIQRTSRKTQSTLNLTTEQVLELVKVKHLDQLAFYDLKHQTVLKIQCNLFSSCRRHQLRRSRNR